jgi:hypothetical protein
VRSREERWRRNDREIEKVWWGGRGYEDLEIFIAADGGKRRLIPVEGINRYKIE